MAMQSFGKVAVTTAATRVRATSALTDPAARVGAHKIRFTAMPANTGYVTVGDSSIVASTGVGVWGIVGIPAANGQVPYTEFDMPLSPNGFNLADFWLDTNVNGSGVIVTVFTQ